MVLLVALRLAIGCHFFYEGVWKISHADEFSARPFLTQAKGPAAKLFYRLVPDLDGRQRLAMTETQNEKGETVFTSQVYAEAWTRMKDRALGAYELDEGKTKRVDALHRRYLTSLAEYITDNREDIEAHFGSLDRLEAAEVGGNQGAQHQKKRLWDRQQKLRQEASGWLSDLDAMGQEYRLALWQIVVDGRPDDEVRRLSLVAGPVVATDKTPLPFFPSWSAFLNFSISWGLAAIGLCMLLGFCNRLACIGGGLFLISVLLSQPPWPSIYPPAPPVVGHALVVDKNFVEMVAVFALAALPVGRWGGLDYFLHHWFGRRVSSFFEEKV